MTRLRLLLWIAMLGAGCSFGPPTVVCPEADLLSQPDCARAVRVATAVLPADRRDFNLVRVEARCRPDPTCPQGASTIILKFSNAGGTQTFVRISRENWRAEVFTPTPPPVPAALGGSA